MFSDSLKYVFLSFISHPVTYLIIYDHSCENPFYNPVLYSPTNKAEIDRAVASARRLLTPHTLLLHMLMSRFQAIRYYKPTLVLWILRLVLRSAQFHKYMRYVLASLHDRRSS